MKKKLTHILSIAVLLLSATSAWAAGNVSIITTLNGAESSVGGSCVSQVSENMITLTVTPNVGYGIKQITAIKTVDGSQGQSRTRGDIPQVSAPLTVTPTDANADPRKETTYTIDNPGGDYDIKVTVDFERNLWDAVVDAAPTAIENLTYNGTAQQLITEDGTATGGEMQYSLDGTTYGTAIPTGTNAGTYTVYYKVVGDANHNDSEAASVNVTIAPNKDDLKVTITDATATYTYNGSAFTPAVTVKSGETPLTGGTDYEVAYTDNINAGEGTGKVTVTGKGNYEGATGSTTFTIAKSDAAIETPPSAKASLVYTGSEQALVEPGKIKGGTMQYSTDGTNYSTTIPTGKDAGEYTVYYKLVGDDNYNDVAEASFKVTIAPASGNLTVTLADASATYTYDGTEKKPAVTVKSGETELKAGTDYEVAYTDNVNAGTETATITVTGKGNYAGATGTAKFTIAKADYDMSGVKFENASFTYDGTAHSLAISGTLPEGVSVSYSENNTLTAVGTVEVTATFATTDENYNAPAVMTAKLTITKVDAKVDAAPTANTLTYTGSAQALIEAGKATGGEMQYSLDGTTYSADIPTGTNADTYKVYYKVVGDDNHNDVAAQSIDVTISKATGEITVTLAETTFTFNGTEQKPEVVVQVKEATLEPSDYEVAYENNINTGDATITVTCKNYEGTGTATFHINPASLSGPETTVDAINNTMYSGEAITPDPIVNRYFTEAPTVLMKGTDYTLSYTRNINAYEGTDSTKQARVDITGIGNYTGSCSAYFNIVKSRITPTITLQGWTYGATPNTPTLDGNLGNGAVTWNYKPKEGTEDQWTTTVPTEVGIYMVRATIAETDNYQGAEPTAEFTIEKAALTEVTLNSTELEYNNAEQTVSVTKVMAGTLEVSADNYTVSGNTATEAGTYTVTVTANDNTNYTGSATATWTINHRTATAEELGMGSQDSQTFGTYYSETEDLKLPENFVGYIITGTSGNNVTTTRISYIPKGVPVLLEKGTSTETATDNPTGNIMHGTLVPKEVGSITGGDVFVLYKGEFVKTTSGTIPANRCYLLLNVAAGTRGFGILTGGGSDGSTGIEAIENERENEDAETWYTLEGRKLDGKPTKNGIYIKGNKKVSINNK